MTESQEQLITDNLKLVYHMAWKLGNTDFVCRNRDDLMSEGMIGLIKAARAFDPGKGIKFATFASRCINNEMLMFIRRNKKHNTNLSLYTVIGGDADGGELLLIDTISAEESELDKAERAADAVKNLEDLTARLTERENKIVKCLREEKTQKTMAAELNLSQSYVSRLIGKIRKKYRQLIERCDCG